MNLGGMAFIGLAVAMAALDGALTTLLFAALLGFTVYTVTRRRVNRLPEQILEIQKAAMAGSDDTPAQKAENKLRREKLEKMLEEQKWGNREMAVVYGIAAFAYPPLGVVALASGTAQHWLPTVKEALRVAPPKPSQPGFYTRMAAC